MMRFLSLCMLCVFTAACSYMPASTKVQNRNKAYLNARSVPPLRIPPGASSQAFHNHYPVSDRVYPPQSETPDLLPPGLNAN